MEEAVARLKKFSRRGSSWSRRGIYESLVHLRKKLSKTSSNDDAEICRFREMGGPQYLLRIVQAADNKIVDMALSMLGNCCLDQETRKIVWRLKGVQHITKILECPNDKANLLNRACRTLANLALDDRIADEILTSGALKYIVNLLEIDFSDSQWSTGSEADVSCLKQSAIRFLRILAATPKRRDGVVNHGVIHVLGKLLLSADTIENEKLISSLLQALVKLSVDCSLDFTEQMLTANCLERLVKLASSESDKFREPSLHVLANLSCQASVRPLLGNAGVIDCLVKRLGIPGWETSSPGFQWAVDALCLCTRESVNRVKVRESNGGLCHLVKLLGEPLNSRLWLCALSALINFLYDDISFTRLVDDENMIEKLLDKLSALTNQEKSVEHTLIHSNTEVFVVKSKPILQSDTRSNCCSPPTNVSSSDFGNFGNNTWGNNPHTCCYSPENSPPYWTSFSNFPGASSSNSDSFSSPSYQSSLNGMSPRRDDFSPEPPRDVEHFCYSPVYESGGSDDEGDIAKSSETSVASESTSRGISPTSESQGVHDVSSITTVSASHMATSSRSPIGDILLLLSKLSLEEKPRLRFLSSTTLEVLLNYVVTVESPQPRAKRIMNRIARNPLCFERLVKLRWIVSLRKRLMMATIHTVDDQCIACQSLDAFGFSVLSDLKLQAQSPFGVGVLHHLILSGRSIDEKVSALLATVHLVNSARILHKILIEADGLSQLIAIMANSSHVDHDVVLDGVVRLAQEVLLPIGTTDTIVNGRKGTRTLVSHCHYEEGFCNNNADDLIQLTVDKREDDNNPRVLAHKSVLGGGCDVFNAMFNGNFAESRLSEVVIGEATIDALKYVVHRVYGCKKCPTVDDVSDDVLIQSLVLADKLLLFDVKNVVGESLMEPGRVQSPLSKIYVHAKNCGHQPLINWIVEQLMSPKFTSDKRKEFFQKMDELTLSTGRPQSFVDDFAQMLNNAIITKAKM